MISDSIFSELIGNESRRNVMTGELPADFLRIDSQAPPQPGVPPQMYIQGQVYNQAPTFLSTNQVTGQAPTFLSTNQATGRLSVTIAQVKHLIY